MKYEVQEQEGKIILVEQNNQEHEFPMLFNTESDDSAKWKPLLKTIIDEDTFVVEEQCINDEEEGDEIYLLVAKLK